MKRNVLVLTMVLGACIPFADLSAAEYFVDAANGSDAYDGTAAKWAGGESTMGPKKTVQAAVKLADGNGTTITLLPGVYDEGGDVNTSNYPQSNRVVITKSNVTLRSSTGKAKDVHVVGQLSTATGNDHGIGEGAMRCLAPNKNVLGTVAVGITFRDGAAIKTTDNYRGGGIWGNSQVTIIDCVVSNCAAARGGGANSITAHSSLFTGNYATTQGTAMYQCSMANCLIIHNAVGANKSPLGHVSKAVNCTVSRNGGSSSVCQDAAPGLSDDQASSAFYNTLIFGHRGGNGIHSAADAHACVIEGNGTVTAHNTDVDTVLDAVAEEECASPTMGDWRPLSTGHCDGRGIGAYLELVKLPAGYTYHDMAGNEIDTNGTVTVGAYQEVVTPAAARIVLGSAYEIEGSPYPRWSTGGWITPVTWPIAYRIRSVDSNVYALYFSEEYTSDGKSRIFMHSQYDGWTTIAPWHDANATNTIVKQSFTRALYVNPDTGSDEFDGSVATPEGGQSTVGPKRTLQGAVDAIPSSGYTIVYAAPGLYREGGTSYDSMSNRVCDVGPGGGRTVGFVATGGPGSATIVGAPDPETQGLGTNAMRCAYLTQKYSFIQGFNITGGFTVNDTDKNHPQYFGAGVRLGSGLTQLLDCTITNNHAGICGGACNGTLIRCRIIGNRADGRAAGTRGASLYRCVVDGNVGPNYHVELFPRIDSCFIGPNAKRANGTTAVNALYNCTGAIVNSLVLIPTIEGTTNPTKATNCVFIAGSGIKDENIVNCILTNLSAVAFDENYRPIVGASVGIDLADETLSDLAFIGTTTDLSGAQGVMNGARDLGALEADWRPRYAEDLGGRCTVTTVSPEVRENAAGHIYLPSGSLEGTFAATSRATRRNLGVLVTGTGKLTVTVAGEVVGEFTANGGDVQNSLLALSTAGDAFVFAYMPGKNDTGGAEIVECMRLVGTALMIR